MQIRKVQGVFFSPTGGTRRVVTAVAAGAGVGLSEEWDLTLPDAPEPDFSDQEETLVVIGVPVYSGRVPATAVERLQKIKGGGIPAVLVVSYGNRHYDDALLELRELATEAGFKPVAAGAFIAEHSFSSDAMPVAAGRPDSPDLGAAMRLGGDVLVKLEELHSAKSIKKLKVPGKKPYREGTGQFDPPICPSVDMELCELCGGCAEVCPTGAITVDEEPKTDAAACIMCMACVRACPTGARVMDAPAIAAINKKLFDNCSERREPETFL
ncbi:4Fe-4S binding protein [Desulfocurvus sp. DL9XJH121]